MLDELPELAVCTAYQINGKQQVEIPSQASGYENLVPVYTKLPGWRTSTVGIAQWDKLPGESPPVPGFLGTREWRAIGWYPRAPTANRQFLWMTSYKP